MSMSMSLGLSTRPIQAWAILIGMNRESADAYLPMLLVVKQLLD
jgi:hypothetical protein